MGWNSDELTETLLDELRTRADHLFRQERQDITLTPTALVNEAYLKFKQQRVQPQDRSHFLALASMHMRRLLVDAARKRARTRNKNVSLDRALQVVCEGVRDPIPLLDLDHALTSLATVSSRVARIVELSFFGGMNDSQIAEYLSLGSTTVSTEKQQGLAYLSVKLALHD